MSRKYCGECKCCFERTMEDCKAGYITFSFVAVILAFGMGFSGLDDSLTYLIVTMLIVSTVYLINVKRLIRYRNEKDVKDNCSDDSVNIDISDKEGEVTELVVEEKKVPRKINKKVKSKQIKKEEIQELVPERIEVVDKIDKHVSLSESRLVIDSPDEPVKTGDDSVKIKKKKIKKKVKKKKKIEKVVVAEEGSADASINV